MFFTSNDLNSTTIQKKIKIGIQNTHENAPKQNDRKQQMKKLTVSIQIHTNSLIDVQTTCCTCFYRRNVYAQTHTIVSMWHILFSVIQCVARFYSIIYEIIYIDTKWNGNMSKNSSNLMCVYVCLSKMSMHTKYEATRISTAYSD